MPADNRFQHQRYEEGPAVATAEFVNAPTMPRHGTAEYDQRLLRLGERLRRENVAAIYLVHGTFVGEDVFGWLNELARVWPTAADLLRYLHKNAIDSLVNDAGNYTEEFAEELGRTSIPTRLFHWSGENHHLGRADGALQLIDDLIHSDFPAGSRILLWGHSHAGNVFALISNLLATDPATRKSFFEAISPHYRIPLLGVVDLPIWKRVWQALDDDRCSVRNLKLDFVTFGTPVRYGWDTNGFSKLLHWVHHRPTKGLPKHRVPFPPTVDDLLHARHGDYVQSYGIAGTNFFPNLLSARSLLAEYQLSKLLQPGLSQANVLDRLKVGLRVPADGKTVLADYGEITSSIAEHVAGHAIYTQRNWLLFHLEETVRRLYDH